MSVWGDAGDIRVADRLLDHEVSIDENYDDHPNAPRARVSDMYIYVYTYKYTYILAYLHIYIHTYIHMCIYYNTLYMICT